MRILSAIIVSTLLLLCAGCQVHREPYEVSRIQSLLEAGESRTPAARFYLERYAEQVGARPSPQGGCLLVNAHRFGEADCPPR